MPDWDNRVSLGADTDSYGIPRVTLLWRKTDRDLETILLATHAFVNGFTNLNLGRARLEDWLIESMDIPPQQEMAGYHHMGGTRMGYSETDSIVDPNLRVHGLQNLYIAGSSVFPTGGFSNPTFTLVQLSLRLAGHLKFKFAK